jgi:hypothetical protein
MILNYGEFLTEMVQKDFFEKNPGFYLNKDKEDEDKSKSLEILKKMNYQDIQVKINKDAKTHTVEFPQFNESFILYEEIIDIRRVPYLWKFILVTIRKLNLNEYLFKSWFDFKENINEIFKNLNDFYGLYYQHGHNNILFITKDGKNYSAKIKHCKSNNIKIIYYNANIKGGREFFDIDQIKKEEHIQKFKNVSVNDLYFKELSYYNNSSYTLHFRDESLDNKYFEISKGYRLDFIPSNKIQTEENLFGSNIGHRFHIGTGLPESLKGIGLGYKIYKALVKRIGYLTSNMQTSQGARGIYRKLLQDQDFYHIIDNDSYANKREKDPVSYQKIIVIDKNYEKISELLNQIKEFEKKNNLKLEYDKRLS